MTRPRVLLAGALVVWGATALAMSDAHHDAPAGSRRPIAFAATRAWATEQASSAALAPGIVSYEDDILPILAANCLDCHSQDQRKGGLSLAAYGDILDGGKDGPIVRPGNSASSMLMHRVLGDGVEQMPKDGVPLTSTEVDLIRRWIDEGVRPAPSAAPAPPPWEAPLLLTAPALPPVIWADWSAPADRIVADYLSDRDAVEPRLVDDRQFARRAYLDIWGLLPAPEELQSFVDDRAPDKRTTLVTRLLADNANYAEHWVSFWNDLLRNDDGVNYYSETGGRRSITPWLLPTLYSNLPYDQFVSKLLNPSSPGDPEGFLIGVNWRGETSAAVTPWMQASQNAAQVFLGVNLKCNACHDSFVNKWKLKDAYGLASFFSPEGRLQLFRCDIAQETYAEPAFLYPELNRTPASTSLADRRTTIAAIFTDRRNGRLARTVVNRVWQRLVGYGIVAVPDEMDGRPWSPELLDWLSSDFVDHGYDLRHLIARIVVSRAYQMPSVVRETEPVARNYVFAGPEVRRLTAEQWSDAIGSITGEWSLSTLAVARLSPIPAPVSADSGRALGPGPAAAAATRPTGPLPTDPTSSGVYVREWRAASSNLTRALGRPIRDQVTSIRATQPTTPQALELVNGGILTDRLMYGARRMLGQLAAEPPSLHNKAVAGRTARPVAFDVDISRAGKLWLVVKENGSNEPQLVLPVWADAHLVSAEGATTALGSLTPARNEGLRAGAAAVRIDDRTVDAVRVANPSVLEFDVAGRGFVRFRGTMWLENPVSDIGATLDPQLRFFVFGDKPNMDRLVPAVPGGPVPALPPVRSAAAAIDRVFTRALGRGPTAAERRAAEEALRDPVNPGRPSAEGLADLLWAVLVKPEFQLVY